MTDSKKKKKSKSLTTLWLVTYWNASLVGVYDYIIRCNLVNWNASCMGL